MHCIPHIIILPPSTLLSARESSSKTNIIYLCKERVCLSQWWGKSGFSGPPRNASPVLEISAAQWNDPAASRASVPQNFSAQTPETANRSLINRFIHPSVICASLFPLLNYLFTSWPHSLHLTTTPNSLSISSQASFIFCCHQSSASSSSAGIHHERVAATAGRVPMRPESLHHRHPRGRHQGRSGPV